MKRLQTFVKTTVLGGVVVMLPIVIMTFVVKWLFGYVSNVIAPFTNAVITNIRMPEIIGDVVVILLILLACFVVGVFVKTRVGVWIIGGLEDSLFRKAPGYSMIKEAVSQLLGREKSPFSTVALVQLFGSDTLVSAFVTDSHPDGSHTVFVPTGPNPTSGMIYHVEGQYVHKVDVPVEETMRTIISCGAGSTRLIQSMLRPTDDGSP
ncbi:MAG: DUF502 domain-containing protein [Candidatus Krumholzibacteria bacterium]|nr:DUF502 domain-containing protein [Candidatus Krumholzibacteria bacterium]